MLVIYSGNYNKLKSKFIIINKKPKSSKVIFNNIIKYCKNKYKVKLMCPENFMHIDEQSVLISEIFKYKTKHLEIFTYSPGIILEGYRNCIIELT